MSYVIKNGQLSGQTTIKVTRDGQRVDESLSRVGLLLFKQARRIETMRENLCKGPPRNERKAALYWEELDCNWKRFCSLKDSLFMEGLFFSWFKSRTGFQMREDTFPDLKILAGIESRMITLTEQYIRYEKAAADARLIVVKGVPSEWSPADACLFFNGLQDGTQVDSARILDCSGIFWVLFETCESATRSADLCQHSQVQDVNGRPCLLECTFKRDWQPKQFIDGSFEFSALHDSAQVYSYPRVTALNKNKNGAAGKSHADTTAPSSDKQLSKPGDESQKARPKPSCAPQLAKPSCAPSFAPQLAMTAPEAEDSTTCRKRKFEPQTNFCGRLTTIVPEKGYGFIEAKRIRRVFNGNMFIHASQIQAAGLKAGDSLTFRVGFDKGRPQAKDARKIDHSWARKKSKPKHQASDTDESG